LDYAIEDDLTAGARLTTGDPDNPNSPYVDLGHGFRRFDFTLDQLFLTWRPRGGSGAWITGGKFEHPFWKNPVYGELVWDADVQPEGLAFGDAFAGSLGRFDAVLGGYSVLEQATASDAFAIVGQLRHRATVRPGLSSSSALGYYHYTDVTPGGATTLVGKGGGNATVDEDGDGTPDDFVSDFGILDGIVALSVESLGAPLTVSVEGVRNLRAEIGADSGWALGATWGRADEAGDWRFEYQWQVIERDAVFAPFVQDDFLLATNHRSHLAGVNYQVNAAMGLRLWALISSLQDTSPGPTTSSDSHQWRVRLDLTLKL
jgi:hypothetical protein